MAFTDVQLAMLAIVLDEEEEELRMARQTCVHEPSSKQTWVHEASKKPTWVPESCKKEKLLQAKLEACKKRKLVLEARKKLKLAHQGRKKRKWVNEACKNRESEGEFAILYKDLVDDETKFFEYFKMSQNSFNILLSKIETHLKKADTHWRSAITPRERLAVCLRFLTTGDSLKNISFSYRLGHSTVHKIVMETCKIITENLMSEVLLTPTTETWQSIAKDFYTHWNFPNCLGALGGKHIAILAASTTTSMFLLALVDAHYNFIAVDVGAFDENGNGGTFTNSNLGRALQGGTLSVPGNARLPGTTIEAPYVIAGDETFPLKTYLMRPYPGQDLDISKRIFNYRLSSARGVAEHAFNILSNKFKILNRRIRGKPENVAFTLLSTCVLHNFVKKFDEITTADTMEITEEIKLKNLPVQGGNASRDAFRAREQFKDFFISENGSLPWLEDWQMVGNFCFHE